MKDSSTRNTGKTSSIIKAVTRVFTLLLNAFITFSGIWADIFFMLAYGSPKFIFHWTAIFIPLTFYAVNFLLLFITATKLGYSKANANTILAVHIFLRFALSITAVCFFLLEFKYIIILLLMSIPCLSGAITAKIIQTHKDN